MVQIRNWWWKNRRRIRDKYGLGTDATRMDIKLKDNREIKLAIGGQLPADDARYVRVDEGPVVAVQTETITNIALSRRDLLDTTPFNMDETNVESLEWEGEAATWMLTSTSENDAAEQTWTLNGKTIEATDAVSLIGKIKNLSTADDVRKASELKNSVPRFTLSVEQTVDGQQVRRRVSGTYSAIRPGSDLGHYARWSMGIWHGCDKSNGSREIPGYN
ncbi:DUF4340 domain-containing protein [Paenibacillus amylolyticus]|nr:DUF4340 domain-containing protein [Paenibacillus amylolyticus]